VRSVHGACELGSTCSCAGSAACVAFESVAGAGAAVVDSPRKALAGWTGALLFRTDALVFSVDEPTLGCDETALCACGVDPDVSLCARAGVAAKQAANTTIKTR
jgi:hypothetical protein